MKRRMWFFFFALCTLLTGAVTGPQTVDAAGSSLSISPTKYDLAVQAGQIQQATVKITNRSDIALPAHVEVMDFAPKDSEGGVTYGSPLPGHSAKAWFSINRPDMILSPGETQTVTATIIPPDNVADGSYFAVVMFQISLPPELQNTAESQAQVVPWIGTLFLLKKGDVTITDPDLTITRFSIPQFTTSARIPVTLEVENHTNFHIVPDTEFELKTIFGTVVAKTTIEDMTVMPGMKRLIKGEIERQSPFGVYKSTANVRVAGFQKSAGGGTIFLITLVGIFILAAFAVGASHSVHHTVRYRHKYSNRFRAAWGALLNRRK